MSATKQEDISGGLGRVLKLLRIANELSIKDLASKMNVSSAFISEVESSKRKPSLEMLDTFSNALNVKKSTIMYFDETGAENGYDYQKLLLDMLAHLIKQKENKR